MKTILLFSGLIAVASAFSPLGDIDDSVGGFSFGLGGGGFIDGDFFNGGFDYGGAVDAGASASAFGFGGGAGAGAGAISSFGFVPIRRTFGFGPVFGRRSFRPRFSSPIDGGFFGPRRFGRFGRFRHFGPVVGAASFAGAGGDGVSAGAFAGTGGFVPFGRFPFRTFPFRRPFKPLYYSKKYFT